MIQKTISLPVIPKFVAEFLKTIKYDKNNQCSSIKDRITLIVLLTSNAISGPAEIDDWLSKKGNFNLIVRAIINGYKVEKETMYVIPLDLWSQNGRQYVVTKGSKVFAIGHQNPIFKKCQSEFTEDELKQLPEWCQKIAVEVN